MKKKKKYISPKTEQMLLKDSIRILGASTQVGKIWDETTQSWIEGPTIGGDASEDEVVDAKKVYINHNAYNGWDEE